MFSSWSLGGMRFIRLGLQSFKNANQLRKHRLQSSATSSSSSSFPLSGELLSNPVLKSGLISGGLSLAGDLLAQLLTNRERDPSSPSAYDATRALRMGSFGLLFYGPYQHFWYRALDRALPGRTIRSFASKVALNQLCLAPLVITGVFTWNLGLQGKLGELPAKVRQDFVPTMLTGWKFWVPAASINFMMVPLQHQVLYMSTCGLIWTAFLSYSSSQAAKEQTE